MNILAVTPINMSLKSIKKPISFAGNEVLPKTKTASTVVIPADYYFICFDKEKEFKEKIIQNVTCNSEVDGKIIRDMHNRPIRVLKPEYSQMLDDVRMDYDYENSHIINASIVDILSNNIKRDVDGRLKHQTHGMIHGTSSENAKNILAHGFDFTKITTDKFGPGIYFAFSEGDAHDYCSNKIKANIVPAERKDGTMGDFGFVRNYFYNDLLSKRDTPLIKTLEAIMDDASKDFNISSELEKEALKNSKDSVIKTILDVYCRDKIVNDLGIDAIYASPRGAHSCMAVFNPNSIVDIQKYSSNNSSQSSMYYY